MKPEVLVISLCLALGACGARSGKAGDAGDAAAPDAGPARRSFDVVATLTKRDVGINGVPEPVETVPAMNRFTLELDAAAGRVIAGGGGQATVAAVTSTDGHTFHVSKAIAVGLSQSPCAGALNVQYQSLDFEVSGDTLTGHATGNVFFMSPTLGRTQLPFDATLDGAPDATPPSLIVPAGTVTDDPLAPFQIWTSEPLPASALARMVGGDGEVAGLVPELIDGPVPLIASFAKATLTLPPGQSFQALFSDDVTDLAGNLAPLGVGLRLESSAAAPLVPGDGFESAAGDALGGAAILREGPGIPIAGTASAYIGQPDSAKPPNQAFATRLVVRMAVPAGATKLAFSYRVLAFGNKSSVGSVQLGSVGRAPGPPTPIPKGVGYQLVMWGLQTFDESAVATLQVPLPDDVGPEVVVVIRTPPTCMTGYGSPGVLIDDLRLE